MPTAAAKAERRRRKWAVVLSLTLFTVTAAALVAASVLIFRTVQAERLQRAQVTRTDEILVALALIGRSAINAETGQRGYFITLDRRYLAPYELGRESYPVALRRLRTLLAGADDPRIGELLAQTERLADARFDELARSVALVDAGQILDAEQAILSDEGQELMVRLRATLAELERIERARLAAAGASTATLEARLMPLLAALLVVVVGAMALGLWQVARAASAEARAAHASDLAEARDRADLLARELNHRVKNLFAVILGIVRMSGRGRPEAKLAVDSITERIHALARAHDMTQGAKAGATVELRQLINTAIAPYCSADERCDLHGPEVRLPADMVMPLGLVLHELVTNAVKYGAWSQTAGAIEVSWRREADRLLLDWRERGLAAPPPGKGRGFGSMLIESSARQLDGSIQRTTTDDGIEVRMDLPLGGAA